MTRANSPLSAIKLSFVVMNRSRPIMTAIASHLGIDAVRERYVSSSDAREARHFQTIWLLAKGHSVGEVAELTSFGRR
jgi:tRNA isopentenyl-2-thiomethyl-A-37 hydroxylase MiaE